MQGLDFHRCFIAPIAELHIDYMVTGSVAAMLYGQPRLTHDIDVVLHLGTGMVEEFCRAFPLDQYYCPPPEILRVELSRDSKAHFNLIHHATGFKADVYLKGLDPFHAWAFDQCRPVDLKAGARLWIAPPEYVIVRKLEFFREGGSEKHLRDIRGILAASADLLDLAELERWIDELRLGDLWTRVSKS